MYDFTMGLYSVPVEAFKVIRSFQKTAREIVFCDNASRTPRASQSASSDAQASMVCP